MVRLLAALLVFAFCAGAGLAQQTEEEDRGFIAGLLEDALGGEDRTVRIIGFAGALSSTATVEKITIADPDGIWLTLDGVEMSWNRAGLLRGEIDIQTLKAKAIALDRLPKPGQAEAPPPEAQGFKLPELPVSVQIGTLAADSIALGAPVLGQAAELSLDASLSLVSGKGVVDLTAQRIDGAEGKIVLKGDFDNATEALSLDLSMNEGAGGIATTVLGVPGAPAATLTATASGTLANLTSRLELRTDDQPRVTGSFDVVTGDDGARQFKADFTGDVSALLDSPFKPFFGPDSVLQAAGTLGSDGALVLDTLLLDTAALDLSGQAALNASGWPVRLDVTGSLVGQNGDPARLPVPGNPVTVQSAEFRLDYDAAKGDGWTARLAVRQPETAGIAFDALTLDGSGTIRATPGTIGSVTADLDFAAEAFAPVDPALQTALGEAFSGLLSLTYTQGQPLAVSQLALRAQGLTLDGSGAIDALSAAFRTDFDVTATVADLARFAPLARQPLTGSGTVKARGMADLGGVFDLVIEAQTADLGIGVAQADALLAGAGALSIDARRDTGGITLRRLDVRTEAAQIAAQGTLATAAADLTVDAQLADIAVLVPQYSGPVTAKGTAQLSELGWLADGQVTGPYGINGTARANLRAALPVVTFDLAMPDAAALGSPYAGPVTIAGTAEQRDGGWTVDTGLTGPLGIAGQVQARIAQQIAADFNLTLPNAADVGSPYPGAATVRGQARQTADGWAVDTDLTGPLGIAGQVQAQIAKTVAANFNLVLPNAADVGSPFPGAVAARGRLMQTPSGWQVVTGLSGPAGTTADITAVLADRLSVNYALQVADVAALGAPHSGALRATGQARQAETGWQVETDVEGPYGMTATAKGTIGETAAVRYALNLPNAATLGAPFSGAVALRGEVTKTEGAWRTETALTGPMGTRADVAGQIAPAMGLSARGRLPLGLLNKMMEPRNIQGDADFDLTVNGTSLSSISGRVALSQAAVVSPSERLTLRRINGDIAIQGGAAQLNLTGRGDQGGKVTISGPVTLSGGFPADLRLTLEDLALSDPQLYKTKVTGEIAVTGPLTGGGTISGALVLGETLVTIPSTFIGALSAIPDINHIGATRPVMRTLERAQLNTANGGNGKAAAARPFGLNLDIQAPARVFVRGRGLDAELGGGLQLTGTTSDIVSAGGAELIRGRIDILNRRFDLDEGRVQLLGDFDPYIRFVAMTETDDGTAGVVVEGRASSPEVRFTATPDIPQDEVLAKLLYGRDLSQLSAFQALELASAVATLAGRGGVGIVGKLRDTFNLDDLDVSSDADGKTQLKLGKYISDNIYTNVTLGQDSQPEVSINIDLTPSITARGKLASDGGTSLGLFYEKDY
ncbi:MAG: translocation/assembly module TamB domain-containing protein [Roseivivax sp.]|nr:translocation/assembly module TamB domain-containing protein [Roseivivax sp.]